MIEKMLEDGRKSVVAARDLWWTANFDLVLEPIQDGFMLFMQAVLEDIGHETKGKDIAWVNQMFGQAWTASFDSSIIAGVFTEEEIDDDTLRDWISQLIQFGNEVRGNLGAEEMSMPLPGKGRLEAFRTEIRRRWLVCEDDNYDHVIHSLLDQCKWMLGRGVNNRARRPASAITEFWSAAMLAAEAGLLGKNYIAIGVAPIVPGIRVVGIDNPDIDLLQSLISIERDIGIAGRTEAVKMANDTATFCIACAKMAGFDIKGEVRSIMRSSPLT